MRVVTADFVLRWCQKTKQGQEKPRAVATVIRPCDICNSCDIAHDLDVEYERVQEGTETVAQIVPQRMRFRECLSLYVTVQLTLTVRSQETYRQVSTRLYEPWSMTPCSTT